jgi:hypothetical protein
MHTRTVYAIVSATVAAKSLKPFWKQVQSWTRKLCMKVKATQSRPLADFVRLLLDKGADIHASKEHMNALSTVCYYGRLEIAELLLKRGADIYRISGNGN